MANSDTAGLSKARGTIAEADANHNGRGAKGNDVKAGTRGTGRDGNGGASGGINRPLKSHPQR